MLRVIASYKKTIPTRQKYGSESVLISLETEMPSGIRESELQEKIHAVFKQTQQAVDRELEARSGQNLSQQQDRPQGRPEGSSEKATNKQIQFILRLGMDRKKGLADLNALADEQFHAATIYELSKKDASKLVDQLRQAA
jgi:hypothetical protein